MTEAPYFAPLPPASLDQSVNVNNFWTVKVAEGTRKEALKDHRYWSHNAAALNVWDEIRVIPMDGAWIARLIVVDKGVNWAKMEILSFDVIQPVVKTDDIPEGYEVVWKGPVLRWIIIRTVDKKQVSDKPLQSKAEAVEWVQSHVKALAA